MLNSVKGLESCTVQAKDGSLGHVHDIFFDERDWTVRYVVVDTRRWLPGRHVLVPREKVGTPDWSHTTLEIDLTKEEVREQPGVESHPPLALDARLQFYGSYVWTSHPWGGYVGMVSKQAPPITGPETAEGGTAQPVSLRSCREIEGYRIEASDGRIGEVEDFVLQDKGWRIVYVVIDTRRWLPGKKVVVPPTEIDAIDWRDELVRVRLDKESIRASPRYEPADASGPFGPRLMEIQ